MSVGWRKWREQLAAEYCGTATVIQQSIPFIFNHFHFLWYINIYFHFHLPLVMKCNLLWHINCDPTINRISIIHCFLRTIQGSIWDKNANKLLKNTSHELHTKHCRYCRFRKGANNKRRPKTIILHNMNGIECPYDPLQF